ncbi:bifunctional protein-serine/threonine kinase/phosphatase [uncultured Jannaschia sp.]|uniref:bifunctional protein-serine/threonine kinase/phosphatase n=1 Tax=uncultured Jannaschia sp. TaxID=293347 RepID=UPI0026092EC8|nr:bifunctional protein-serine/threonine kinase/phosphatase [uncultured Jannaschia sp.]
MPRDTTSPDALRVSIGQAAAAGRKPVMQDFHGALVPEGEALTLKGITLAVADGISSSAVSGEAAETAIGSLLADYYATPDPWTVRTAATRVIAATNAWLHGRNATLSDIDTGRVTTLAALILKGRAAHVLHVGDSRVQRIAGGALERLTEDHRVTLAGGRSYLDRALGAAAEVEVDYRRVALSEGDTFLLTTDGVHDHMDPDIVRDALSRPDLDAAARAILDAALAAGSDDNLTVQIVRIDALPDGAAGLAPEAADLPVPPLPRAGEVIDGFRIVRPVQVSARSHVFRATAADGTEVALKIPASDITQDARALRRFQLEEWIARRVASPHLVAAGPAPERRSALYVTTTWVEGTNLRQWMTDHPRPAFEEVRGIVEQVTAGLRALHRREMIHQDLRPENVMLDRDGTAKIIDLGSVTVAGVEEAAPGLLGEMPGTFQYTAPEYLSGDAVSWRSDQYALGVLAYEMLTGRLPYGAQVARIRSRRDQGRLRYETARDDRSGVPDWMDTALRRALHPDPLRRYDALSEFLADLRRPGPGWKAGRHVPLAERNPVRFWQGVSAALAVLCVVLAAQLGGR